LSVEQRSTRLAA